MATFEIPKLNIAQVKLTLVGDATLVTNVFHQTAIDKMLGKQMGKAVSGKEPKDPIKMFVQSMHVWPGTTPVVHGTYEDFEQGKEVYATGKFGFPAVGIKACAVTAAKDCKIAMTDARRAFHIEADLCEIICSPGPYMRMDAVKPQFNVTDIAFRPEFRNWRIPLNISFNKDVISAEQIVNLFFRAGYGVGIGAFRPERDGQWGRFSIAPEIEIVE